MENVWTACERGITARRPTPEPSPRGMARKSHAPLPPRTCPQLHVDNLAVLPTNVQPHRRFNYSDVTSPSITGLKMDKTEGSVPVTIFAVEMVTQHKEGLSTS